MDITAGWCWCWKSMCAGVGASGRAMRCSNGSACDGAAAQHILSHAETLHANRQRYCAKHKCIHQTCHRRRDIAPGWGSLEETTAALRAVVALAEVL